MKEAFVIPEPEYTCEVEELRHPADALEEATGEKVTTLAHQFFIGPDIN